MAFLASRCSALCTYAARTLLRSWWLICRSTVSRDHRSDSTRTLQAIALSPCPQISVFVSYPIRRSARLVVFSLIGLYGLWSPGNTRSRWPESSCICFRMAIAWRESGTICGVRIFAPRPENRTLSMASRVAGMVQILCLKSISLQRAKRSSLERMNRCNVSTTASRVNSRPCR